MKLIRRAFGILLAIYVLILVFFHLEQENFVFDAHQAPLDSVYDYRGNVEEAWVTMNDDTRLHTATFIPDSSIGSIFYLHGNYHGIYDTHRQAYVFVDAGYTVFMPDYRNFGKSEGKYENEAQFLSDADELYQHFLKTTSKDSAIIVGYSLGSSLANYLAAKYQPKKLILKSPFYSGVFMKDSRYPFLPTALMKYPLRSNEWIAKVKSPITIFHGTKDKIIPIESSYKLQKLLKPTTDTLIILNGEDHLELDDNAQYTTDVIKAIHKNY